MMETIAQEAKRILEGIDKSMIIGSDFDYENELFYGRKTAFTWFKDAGVNVQALADASYKYLRGKGFGASFYWDVNDKKIGRYHQDSRKDRLVALFEDMIAAGL